MPDSITFDHAASFYDETRGFPAGVAERVAALIATTATLTPNSLLVESGIGTGRMALPLARHVRAVVGVDLARLMLARLHTKRTVEPVFAVEGDACRLPWPRATFDAAIVAHIFHLIPNWPSALAELGRVLKPEGVLLNTYTVRGKGFQPLVDALAAAIPNEQRQPVGLTWDERQTFLLDRGWQRVTQATLPITSPRTPRQFREQVAMRSWSSLWALDDTTIQRGVAAIDTAIAQHYASADSEMLQTDVFHVEVFRQPA